VEQPPAGVGGYRLCETMRGPDYVRSPHRFMSDVSSDPQDSSGTAPVNFKIIIQRETFYNILEVTHEQKRILVVMMNSSDQVHLLHSG